MKTYLIITVSIIVLLLAIIMIISSFNTKEKVFDKAKEIHKEELTKRLINLERMVRQNDNDLLLKVITKEEHQNQLGNYNKQIDEIEKELANL